MAGENRNEYDQAATVFSPDGRVYQVEYAREAIKRGGLAMGIKFKGGIIFTIDKTLHSKLVEEDDLQKFYKITSTVGAAASGLIADARVLSDLLRDISQDEYVKYGEGVDIKYLVGRISRIYEIYTRYEGVRPFGACLIIGGKDSTGYRLYETDPSGVYQERVATAIGNGGETAIELLEKDYKPDMSGEEALALTCTVLKTVMVNRPPEDASDIEVHIITDQGFDIIEVDRDRLLHGDPKEICPRKLKQLQAMAGDLGSFLEDVPKLSPDTRTALVERFGSIEALSKADMDDLMSVKGVGRATAERIMKALSKCV